jgi:hypothetical protein
LRERLIEPQNLGGEVLQIGSLGRVISVTDANERAQNQREQQGEQSRHLTDDALRLARLVRGREPCLRVQPSVTGSHEQNENNDAD